LEKYNDKKKQTGDVGCYYREKIAELGTKMRQLKESIGEKDKTVEWMRRNQG
jgi:hypothetical protein